jgi:hypothetical protein
MLYRHRSATPISPMVGFLGAIAVIALLVVGTFAFHGSSNGSQLHLGPERTVSRCLLRPTSWWALKLRSMRA